MIYKKVVPQRRTNRGHGPRRPFAPVVTGGTGERDSPLEESGFEPPVPPGTSHALDPEQGRSKRNGQVLGRRFGASFLPVLRVKGRSRPWVPRATSPSPCVERGVPSRLGARRVARRKPGDRYIAAADLPVPVPVPVVAAHLVPLLALRGVAIDQRAAIERVGHAADQGLLNFNVFSG